MGQLMRRMKWQLGLGLIVAFVALLTSSGNAIDSVTVRVDRWLAVSQFDGSVTIIQAGKSRAAQSGDRLQNVGDGLTTGNQSTATLEVDTAIGTINVAENTDLKVQALEVLPSDGRITRLQVDRGRVRLQVRPFTNPDSRLEINTPAGVSGVRGTEFGISVSPDGKMGVATLDGKVVTSAEGQDVEVPAGFQNVTIPGEPPSAPVPFTNEPRLTYQIDRIIRRGIRRIVLNGQVDPTSSVLIKGKPQAIDRDGRFSLVLPAPSRLKLSVTVTTALGQAKTYVLRLI
jgi:hypothetical protein